MSNFIPGFRNQIILGSGGSAKVLPVLPGSSFSMPKNYAIPELFSGNNLFQYVAVEGLQYPMISLNTMITKGWFSAALLNGWFITRTNDDVADIGGLTYWDGKRGVAATGCKVNVMTIGATKGETLMRCRVTIMGAGAISVITEQPDTTTLLKDTPAAFHHVTLSGGLNTTGGHANACAAWDLMLSNNLDMCPELNATPYPTEHNSGRFTATLRVVKQAGADVPVDGTSCAFAIAVPGGSTVTLTAQNPLYLDPNERTVQSPRQMREFNAVLLGKDAGGTFNTNAPVLIA